jgi:hypothetical protein
MPSRDGFTCRRAFIAARMLEPVAILSSMSSTIFPSILSAARSPIEYIEDPGTAIRTSMKTAACESFAAQAHKSASG